MKKVMGLLEEKHKCDLQEKKELIKKTINEVLAEKESGDEEEEEEEESPAKKGKKNDGKGLVWGFQALWWCPRGLPGQDSFLYEKAQTFVGS